jgi:hypothetical protein
MSPADGDPDAQVLAAAGVTPEQLGRRVRARWLDWAARQPAAVLAAHPSWLLRYDALSPEDRAVDDQIGTDLFCAGWHARGRVQDRTAPEPGPAADLKRELSRMRIRIMMTIDPEYADAGHYMGVTEAGYAAICAALDGLGEDIDVAAGPP